MAVKVTKILSPIGLIIMTVLILVGMFSIKTYQNNRERQQLSNSQTLGETAPVVSIPISSPYLSPSPKSINKAYVDPDPIENCNFKYIGVKQLRRSVCVKSTECQLGSNWVYYDSVDKCKQDQDAYSANYYKNNSNYSVPTNNYSPPSSNSNPAPTTNYQNQGKSNAELRSECIAQVKANYDPLIAKYQAQAEPHISAGPLIQQRDAAIGSCSVQYPTYLD